MLSERRGFERFDATFDAAIKSTKYIGEWFAGEIKNVSRGGLCLATMDIQPDLNSHMELEVKLPDGSAYVNVSGSVAWKTYADNSCLLGIQFADMDDETKKLFYSLCV